MTTNKKLLWSRLKNNKCALCNAFLEEDQVIQIHKCTSNKCSFSCSKEKFDQIVNGLYKDKSRSYEPKPNNRQLLNEL